MLLSGSPPRSSDAFQGAAEGLVRPNCAFCVRTARRLFDGGAQHVRYEAAPQLQLLRQRRARRRVVPGERQTQRHLRRKTRPIWQRPPVLEQPADWPRRAEAWGCLGSEPATAGAAGVAWRRVWPKGAPPCFSARSRHRRAQRRRANEAPRAPEESGVRPLELRARHVPAWSNAAESLFGGLWLAGHGLSVRSE